MQMHSVASKVGTPTSPAPSMIASLERLAQADMALDVFDHHRAVVDQDADRERKAAERHGIERLAADVHDQHRGDDRQRNRRENDQRQAPVAQEQQDHQRRQRRRP